MLDKRAKELASPTLSLIERLSYRTINLTRRNHGIFITLAIGAWFRKQALEVGSHVDEMTKANSDQIFDDNSSVDNARLERSIMLAYLAGLLWASSRYDLGTSYDETSIPVVLYRQHVIDLITQLNNTTKADISNVLVASEDANLTLTQQSKALKQLFVSYETSRATLVGSYESLRAFNLGNHQAILDSAATGLSYDKLWLTAGDERVEQDCLDNAAQGWIGLSVVYNDGLQCPPAHIGCRCALDYRRA